MKTTGVLLVTSFASVIAIALTVGCATSPSAGDTTNDNNDTASPTPKKSQASPTPSASGTTPTPSPTSTSDAGPTEDGSTSTDDPTPTDSSCDDLASCCPQLTDSYSQIACIGAQLSGNETACAASLIACQASIGLGGSSGGSSSSSGGAGTACMTDLDCAGALLCENKVCT